MTPPCAFCGGPLNGGPVDAFGVGLCPRCVRAGAVLCLVASRRDPATVYTVRGTTAGPWTCTCPAHGECWHIREVRARVRPVEPQGVPSLPAWPVRGRS